MTQLISYSVPDSEVQRLRREAYDILKERGRESQVVEHSAHISVAMIEGHPEQEVVERLHQEGRQFKPVFKGDHLEKFPGRREPKDFIVVKLDASPPYNEYLEHVAKEVDVVRHPGGNKPHVSLLTTSKGHLDYEDLNALNEEMDFTFTLRPETVQLWGDNQKVIREIAAARELMAKNKKESQHETEERIFSSTTPLHVVSMDPRRFVASSEEDMHKVADLILTMKTQMTSNAPDKFDRMEATLKKLEAYLV